MLSPSLFWGKLREPKAWVIGAETRRRVSGIVRWSWRFEFASESETKLQLWGDDPLCNNRRQKGKQLIHFNCPLTGGSLILAGRISLIFFFPRALRQPFPPHSLITLFHIISLLSACVLLSDLLITARSLSPSLLPIVAASPLASPPVPLSFFPSLPPLVCLLLLLCQIYFFFWPFICLTRILTVFGFLVLFFTRAHVQTDLRQSERQDFYSFAMYLFLKFEWVYCHSQGWGF